MKNILLIYNLIPDDVKYFIIPSDHGDINIIKGAHGALINVTDPTEEQSIGHDYINDAATDNTEYCRNPDNVGKIREYEVSEESLLESPVEGVVICSFFL